MSVDGDVAVGDEVVLIGEQGGERIRADEWADRLGTIGYEIVCGIGSVGVRGPPSRSSTSASVDPCVPVPPARSIDSECCSAPTHLPTPTPSLPRWPGWRGSAT